MATFNVDSYETMGKVATKLQDHSQNYTQIYNELLTTAASMGNAWVGEDNTAFVKRLEGCGEALKNMASKLNQAAMLINNEKDNYKNTQEGIINDIPKLPNS